jgi:hypothetical protein
VGFIARHEATGDANAANAVANFFDILLRRHSYSTGGSNMWESWHPEGTMADDILKASVCLPHECTPPPQPTNPSACLPTRLLKGALKGSLA